MNYDLDSVANEIRDFCQAEFKKMPSGTYIMPEYAKEIIKRAVDNLKLEEQEKEFIKQWALETLITKLSNE